MQQFLVKSLSGATLCVTLSDDATCRHLQVALQDATGVPACHQRILVGGKDYLSGDTLPIANGAGWHSAQMLLRVMGGKGGFGSNLRSMGARAATKETTNFEACRDLEGRRLRTVHDEQKMAEWIASEEKRKQEADEKKRRKQEAIMRGPLHKFDHHKLGAESREINSQVEEAVSAVLEKRKAESKPAKTAQSAKKLKMWDEDDVDSDESDDDSAEGKGKAAASTDSDSATSVVSGKQPADSVRQPNVTATDTTSNEDAGTSTPAAGSAHKTPAAAKEASPQPVEFPAVNLAKHKTVASLEKLGLDHLKHALTARGLKCGGNAQQRAERLFAVKGLNPEEYPAALLAKK